MTTPGESRPAPEDHFVGVVVPYDMALDHELWRWMPEGVRLLFTRTPYAPLPVTVEMAETVGDADVVRQSTLDLATVRPDAFAYGCTSGSFVNGRAGERRIAEAMQQAGEAPAVTASGALLQALVHLGVQRVATATPYEPGVAARLTTFLGEAGIEVTGSAHLGLTGDIWKVPGEQVLELVRAVDTPAADAILLSCTNLPTYDVIATLEEQLGKPVVSANQALAWAALRLLGRQGVGPGQRLFTTGAALPA